MADGTRRVFSVNGPAQPHLHRDRRPKRPDVRFNILKNDSADDVATPILAGGARLPGPVPHVTKLAKKYSTRAPDLLAARTQKPAESSRPTAAGYEHRQT